MKLNQNTILIIVGIIAVAVIFYFYTGKQKSATSTDNTGNSGIGTTDNTDDDVEAEAETEIEHEEISRIKKVNDYNFTYEGNGGSIIKVKVNNGFWIKNIAEKLGCEHDKGKSKFTIEIFDAIEDWVESNLSYYNSRVDALTDLVNSTQPWAVGKANASVTM